MSTNSNFFQNRSLIRNTQDILVTPTYNLNDYGKDLFIPLSSAGVNTSTFANNTNNEIIRTTFTDPNSVTGEEIDDYPTVIANEDTLTFWHAGDDTQYSRTFRYTPDAQAVITKAYMNVAFILNMSARSGGDRTFDTVQVDIVERANDSGVGDKPLFSNLFNVGGTARDAAGEKTIFILSAVFGDMNITRNLPLDFTFTTNVSGSGTNTWQEGIVPFFAFNTESNVKVYSLSGLGLHLQTDFDNAQQVMRKAGSTTKGYFINDFGTPKSIGS